MASAAVAATAAAAVAAVADDAAAGSQAAFEELWHHFELANFVDRPFVLAFLVRVLANLSNCSEWKMIMDRSMGWTHSTKATLALTQLIQTKFVSKYNKYTKLYNFLKLKQRAYNNKLA